MARPEMLEPKEVFRRVFLELGFPILSVDLTDLQKFVAHPDAKEGGTYDLLLVSPRGDRRDALIGAWRGLIRSIEIPPAAVDLFARSTVFKTAPVLAENLRRLLAAGQQNWMVAEGAEHLRWSETTPWPVAYSMFLGHLARLILGYSTMLDQRVRAGKEKGIGATLDQASRLQPTRHHYAAASLGAWVGGATAIQYFSFYATDPQCRKPEKNEEYARRMRYGATDAAALTRSGLIAVPASLAAPLLNAQGDSTVFGALPIDEWSGVNLPYLTKAIKDLKKPRHHGLLVDKYYRAPFYARPLVKRGLLGRKDVLRDHYADFYKAHATTELIRCKHYCAPIINVQDRDQLASLIAEIPLRAEAMHFRGQSRLHELKRDPKVRALLFGDSTSREPSLITSAARTNFDYDALHFALRYYIQDRILGATPDPMESLRKHTAWREQSMLITSPIDYAVMALAQHYGLPSHGLDVTDDVDVALWFATNRFQTIDGISSYTTMRSCDWDDHSAEWPVIFASQQVTHSLNMSTQTCEELDKFGLPAMRPRRQKASFFLGGHSDHQNRLAETVVCAFRLAPGDWSTACTFDGLFPSPAEDPAYAAMLEFAASADFRQYGAGKVARYHR
ncbi:FRG domain-containing protein [Sphingomonas sp. CROZ-RG-20F-R02-07]|uniref:FRG domain-containing protein n=1 Tax=Sphingomonas sp. CROZ-RG-20F-R02-07 TaxID=2914832 RepID=UPI001F590FD2|nr:FRG domain-containing protein [Sphingomonas sp. CROZ-RG-20F-R02-07]